MKYHESIYVNESVPKAPKKSAGNTKLCGFETDIADVLDVSYHIRMTGRFARKLSESSARHTLHTGETGTTVGYLPENLALTMLQQSV